MLVGLYHLDWDMKSTEDLIVLEPRLLLFLLTLVLKKGIVHMYYWGLISQLNSPCQGLCAHVLHYTIHLRCYVKDM